jgi:hypothetical protein
MVVVLVIILSVATSVKPSIISKPPDFYGTSKEVTLEEMTGVANENDISIYLPESLPKDLKLTAVYLKESPFIAILVYSAEGNKDYKSAELTLEIAPVGPKWIPIFNELQSEAEKSPDKTAIQINNWPVLIHENADAGGNTEQIEKYGQYTLLINIWIENIGYSYNASTLTTQNAISMIETMQLLSTT